MHMRYIKIPVNTKRAMITVGVNLSDWTIGIKFFLIRLPNGTEYGIFFLIPCLRLELAFWPKGNNFFFKAAADSDRNPRTC